MGRYCILVALCTVLNEYDCNKYTVECSPILQKYFLRNKFRGGINLSIHEMGVRPNIYQMTLCHNPFVMYFILPVWFIDFYGETVALRRKSNNRRKKIVSTIEKRYSVQKSEKRFH